MNDLQRAMAQMRSDLRVFLRNPAALFFGAILPVVFLILFVSIFGNDKVPTRGNIREATLQVPAFVVLAIVSTSFVGLAIGLTRVRESGVLKRIRATPVAPGIVFAGRIGTAVFTATVITVILLAIGYVAFDVSIPGATLPAFVVTIALGAACYCALGIAFTRAISSVDAAPAMTNAIVLPLYFISGVFVPIDQLPDGLRQLASVLPVEPFVDALQFAFDPRTTGAGFKPGDLAVMAAWGLVGLLFAARYFVWTPRHQAG